MGLAGKLLANISWRNKILGVSTIYMLGIVIVGALGVYTINVQNKDSQIAIQSTQTESITSQARIKAAVAARIAILGMNLAQAEVISATSRADTREAAIKAIEKSSALDESIQNLQQILSGNAAVIELAELIEKIKPMKMEVIKAARKNDDEGAMASLKAMESHMMHIDDLSKQIISDEEQKMVEDQLQLNESFAKRVEEGKQTNMVLMTIIGAGIVIGVLLSLFTAKLINKPLTLLTHAMRAMSEGDLKIQVERQQGRDEICQILNAVSDMAENLHSIVSNIHNDANSLDNEAQSVSGGAGQIQDVSARMLDSVKHIKQDADVVLGTIEQAVSDLGRASDNAVETSNTVRFTVDKISGIVASFHNFQNNMDETAEVARGLARSANSITSITNTIREIASQTNLLALNAAVEAARAGDEGRGFAVVADEVRELAIRTANAITDITSIVDEITDSVNRADKMIGSSVNEARENISNLQAVVTDAAQTSEKTETMLATMKNVVKAIDEQKFTIQGINQSVNGLLDLSEETTQQADLLNELSQALNSRSVDLNKVVDRFQL